MKVKVRVMQGFNAPIEPTGRGSPFIEGVKSGTSPELFQALHEWHANREKVEVLEQFLLFIDMKTLSLEKTMGATTQKVQAREVESAKSSAVPFDDPSFFLQIEGLEDLLKYLSLHLPKSLEVKALQEALNKLKQQYLNEGKIDYNQLTLLEVAVVDVAKQLQGDVKIEALKKMLALLTYAVTVIKEGDPTVNSRIIELTNTVKAYQNMQNALDQVASFISRIAEAGSLSNIDPQDWGPFIANYMTLMRQYNLLQPNDQLQIQQITNALKGVVFSDPVKGSANLLDLMAAYYIWGQYSAAGATTGMTMDQYRDMTKLVQAAIDNIVKQSSSNPALADFVNSIKKFPLSLDTKGPLSEWFFRVAPQVDFNVNFGLGWTFPISPSTQASLNAAVQTVETLGERIVIYMPQYIAQIKTLTDVQNQLIVLSKPPFIDKITKTIEGILIDLQVEESSLPDAFYNLIINRYMPIQEARLQQLAMYLYFANIGGANDNALLEIVTGWTNASNTFNFVAWVKGGSYDPTQIQQRATAENAAIGLTINQANQALTTIDAQIKKIDNDPQLTAERKAELKAPLLGFKSDIQTALNNLNQLKALFATMPPPTDPSWGSWLQSASQYENLIVSGDPGDPTKTPPVPPIKGIMQIANSISTDATGWTTLSTNQQMQLQLAMTNMQQQWGLVTACMQMLNQMYMTVARGIAPR